MALGSCARNLVDPRGRRPCRAHRVDQVRRQRTARIGQPLQAVASTVFPLGFHQLTPQRRHGGERRRAVRLDDVALEAALDGFLPPGGSSTRVRDDHCVYGGLNFVSFVTSIDQQVRR